MVYASMSSVQFTGATCPAETQDSRQTELTVKKRKFWNCAAIALSQARLVGIFCDSVTVHVDIREDTSKSKNPQVF